MDVLEAAVKSDGYETVATGTGLLSKKTRIVWMGLVPSRGGAPRLATVRRLVCVLSTRACSIRRRPWTIYYLSTVGGIWGVVDNHLFAFSRALSAIMRRRRAPLASSREERSAPCLIRGRKDCWCSARRRRPGVHSLPIVAVKATWTHWHWIECACHLEM